LQVRSTEAMSVLRHGVDGHHSTMRRPEEAGAEGRTVAEPISKGLYLLFWLQQICVIFYL